VGGGKPGQGGEGAKRPDLEAVLRSEQAGAEGRRRRHESNRGCGASIESEARGGEKQQRSGI
jgi:hypothetical protein